VWDTAQDQGRGGGEGGGGGEGTEVRWDILIRELAGGNFFVGMAEVPIASKHNGAGKIRIKTKVARSLFLIGNPLFLYCLKLLKIIKLSLSFGEPIHIARMMFADGGSYR
jgi:hypothetical protein